MSLQGKRIVIGLTGGIACYKIPYLVRAIRAGGGETTAVMTRSATEFITPLTLETLSGRPVAVEMFPAGQYVSTRHIDLAQWADLLVIAPATANFLGKTAHGISDDLLTTVVCATPCPVMIVPAMNPHMWENKTTQRNCGVLKDLGYLFVGPDRGETACGDSGVGRMVEPDQILAAIETFFREGSKKKILKGKKVVVTAGPSREAVDPVRFLSNYSSGKMGYALAEAAATLGAETVLISGPTSLRPPIGVSFVPFESTAELEGAVKTAFDGAHCLLMAAAPADFRPADVAGQKIKRTGASLSIVFEPTADVLKGVCGRRKKEQVVVGFALETEKGLDNARRKLRDKNVDMIVLNEVGEDTGFDSDTIRRDNHTVGPETTALAASGKAHDCL